MSFLTREGSSKKVILTSEGSQVILIIKVVTQSHSNK